VYYTYLLTTLLSARDKSGGCGICKINDAEEQKRLWTLSMQKESAAIKGSHKMEEYSKRGHTREQYKALRELESLNSLEEFFIKYLCFKIHY